MINVAITYIAYPVAMGRYFHEALLRRTDCNVVCVAPFTSRWIPWNGGMDLPAEYVRKPDLSLPFVRGTPPSIVYKMVEEKLLRKPDLWIEVNGGLNAVGRPSCAFASVLSDPHVLDYARTRASADYVFNMQTPYMEDGDIWLPYGYDPVWHEMTPFPAEERTNDVALLGLQYGDRVSLFNRLRGEGYETKFETGLAYEDARDVYWNTKVGVNWSSQRDTTARVFEIMALGIAPVFNTVDAEGEPLTDLLDLFRSGEDFMGFTTLDEAHSIVKELVADPARCNDLGFAAREAVAPHTWDARVEKILGIVGVI